MRKAEMSPTRSMQKDPCGLTRSDTRATMRRFTPVFVQLASQFPNCATGAFYYSRFCIYDWPMGFATTAIHSGQDPDQSTGAVTVPIYQTSTYAQDGLGRHKGYEYARTQNPTRSALEKNIAALENAKFGFAFASGMAAIDAVLKLVKGGEHVILGDNTYGGTYRLFSRILSNYGVEFDLADTSDAPGLEKYFKPNTKLLFVETPTNPVMTVTDLKGVSDLAHSFGAKVVCDNTFMSPYLQQPIEFGVDIVVHSTTKYLN